MWQKTGRIQVYKSSSEAMTIAFGQKLGQKINSGLLISIVGVLGAGKTILVRGLCRGLGVKEQILSPTFILYEEFEGRLPVVHLDLYRLEHEKEIEELGVFDKLGTECVVLTEWGDRSPYLLDSSDMIIKLHILGESSRDIEITFTEGRGKEEAE